MAAAKNEDRDTAVAILDVAERLVQERGFNAFSYADVAGEIGITKAALHYHFSGKAELGESLVARYTSRFNEALESIDSSGGIGARKLSSYAELYARVLAEDRMCLCGMLAAEFHTLPHQMRVAVISFLDRNEAWLAAVIDQGRRDGSLQVEGPSREVARMVLGALEGAMLVARTYRDPSRFESSASHLLAEITSPESPTGPRSSARR